MTRRRRKIRREDIEQIRLVSDEAMIEAVAGALRESAQHARGGELFPQELYDHPWWALLDERGRDEAWQVAARFREMERAIDTDGLSTTVRAVLDRLPPEYPDPREWDLMRVAMTGAFREHVPSGPTADHERWRFASSDDKLASWQMATQLREIESAVHEEGLSTTALAVLARISAGDLPPNTSMSVDDSEEPAQVPVRERIEEDLLRRLIEVGFDPPPFKKTSYASVTPPMSRQMGLPELASLRKNWK